MTAILPWLCDLAMCCFSPNLKREMSHAKSGFFSKEYTLMPFKWWKFPESNYCSECMKQHIGTSYRKKQGRKKASVAFLSQDALGLVSVHWVYILSNKDASKLLFSRACVLAILPWLHEPAMVLFTPLVNRRHCHAKLDFYSKNTFAVPFKWWKVPEPHYCSESMRQHIDIFSLVIGKL